MKTISVSDYLIETLIANKITDVFGYQGGMIAYVFDSLGKYKNKINYHSCATEQGAAFAACGYAQATGKLGVAISTSGPGFTNLLTGIANAWFDSIPVLFISGNVNTKDKKRNLKLRQNGFQEIQAASIATNITKLSYEIELNTDYQKCFDEAIRMAMTNRKGPVFLDLPINVCREKVKYNSINSYKEKEIRITNIKKYINPLINSKKPVIIAGAGIIQSNYKKQFNELVSMLGIPVVTTLPAISLLPSSSKYNFGYIGGTGKRLSGLVLENADYILSLGTRLCSKQIGHNMNLFAPKAKRIIRIDIDDTEFERHLKDNEIDVKMDLRSFILSTIKYLKDMCYLPSGEWLKNCDRVKNILAKYDNTNGNIIVNNISRQFLNNSNIVIDVGKNMTYCGQSLVINKNTNVYMSAGLGSMGYAIPASIGIYLGNKKQTYVIVGDGGAQMNIQELNIISKENLPIKIIVLNNKALGNIKMFQENYLNNRYIATTEECGDYYSCNFKEIAKAYGIESYKLKYDKKKDIKMKFNDSRPNLIEVVYDDCKTMPGIVAGGQYLNNDISKFDIDLIKKIFGINNDN